MTRSNLTSKGTMPGPWTDTRTAETIFREAVVNAVANIVPELEKYRDKNVNKYHREKDLEFSEYTKMERYKNRVRAVDCFLPPLKMFLGEVGIVVSGTPEDEKNID